MVDVKELERELEAIQIDRLYIKPSVKKKTEENERKDIQTDSAIFVEPRDDSRSAELQYIDENIVGKETCFQGPYGEKQAIYCDYTASGRPLRFIEEYITNHVHPVYANTHTTTGVMARQTTQFRHEARQIIKKCVNASEEYALIFTGSGTTAAIHKLVTCMELHGERAKKTVVFVGPYEHHSNILPWKESGAKIIRIQDNHKGLIDMVHLEEQLQHYHKKKFLLIGCFSAASNITGILSDTHAVATLLHKYGALSFWDYATAGPYVQIDMKPEPNGPSDNPSKDAVYLSPHKFVGGVGTPGILIARTSLFINKVPSNVGGGTVCYVTESTHCYMTDIETREEGGTPAIVESIRAGLTFQIKESVGARLIEEREEELTRLAFRRWRTNPNIIILGSKRVKRLPIFSFMIVHQNSGKVLHHDFVAILLNDLYGIQARGGCACAGPYAQNLLGIDEKLAKQFTDLLVPDNEEERAPSQTKERKSVRRTHSEQKNCKGEKPKKGPVQIIKPGFCRLNLPYFVHDDVIDYIIEAVDNLAIHGWKLLPQYSFDIYTGEWKKCSTDIDQSNEEMDAATKLPMADSLLSATFIDGQFHAPETPFRNRSNSELQSHSLQRQLNGAITIYAEADQWKRSSDTPMTAGIDNLKSAVGDEQLIWFLRPNEALWHLQNPSQSKPQMSKIDKHIQRRTSALAELEARTNRTSFKVRSYSRGNRLSSRRKPTTKRTINAICTDDIMREENRKVIGHLGIHLEYHESGGLLKVYILRAIDLDDATTGGFNKYRIRISLQPEKQSGKTQYRPADQPVFEELFRLRQPKKGLDRSKLLLKLQGCAKYGKGQILGNAAVGLCALKEVSELSFRVPFVQPESGRKQTESNTS